MQCGQKLFDTATALQFVENETEVCAEAEGTLSQSARAVVTATHITSLPASSQPGTFRFKIVLSCATEALPRRLTADPVKPVSTVHYCSSGSQHEKRSSYLPIYREKTERWHGGAPASFSVLRPGMFRM